MAETLIAFENLRKSFKKAANQELVVLEDVNFKLEKGEIVALLENLAQANPTLLRIIAGLSRLLVGQ